MENTQLTQIDTLSNSVQALLEKNKDAISAALPKHLTVERMTRIALTEARKNPTLLQCDKASLLGAVIQAAQLGLEPGGALGHCYLIPFRNKKTGRTEVQFIVGYRGMLDLVRRSGYCSNVVARAVYEGDDFDYDYGLEEKLSHKPKTPSGPTKLTHVYAIATMTDGRRVFDVMERMDIDDIRARSKSADSGPWVTDFEAMAKKTVIRRLFKYLPSSIEMQRAIGLDELADAGETQANESVVGVDAPAGGGNASSIKQAFSGRQVKDVQSEVASAPEPEQEPVVDEEPPQSEPQAPESDSDPTIKIGTKYVGRRMSEVGPKVLETIEKAVQAKAVKSGAEVEFLSDLQYHRANFNPDFGQANLEMSW